MLVSLILDLPRPVSGLEGLEYQDLLPPVGSLPIDHDHPPNPVIFECIVLLGLYANLEKFNLPYPEAVFDINFFRKNPKPCQYLLPYLFQEWLSQSRNMYFNHFIQQNVVYALAKELQPGSFLPTPTHHFISLLHRKSLLHLCLTQNIDCLERLAGLPEAKVVEAHGSFASNSCIENGCGKKFDGEKMKKCVDDGKVPKCDKCGGLVKPDIVFFGEGVRFLLSSTQLYRRNMHADTVTSWFYSFRNGSSVQCPQSNPPI